MWAQHGEEQKIQSILEKITFNFPNVPFFLEFGAHDGKTNCNFRFLAESGHSGIFIEGDDKLFGKLEKNTQELPVHVFHEMVDVDKNSLRKILLRNNLKPENISMISIDIDSDDAAVFDSIDWELDIALVEFNPTIPFDAEFVQPYGKSWGNSALSIHRIATNKGMFLVDVTETNLIFVNNKYRNSISEVDLKSVDILFDQLRFGLGYDGTVVMFSRKGTNLTKEVLPLGWTNSHWVQPIPPLLRRLGRYEKSKLLISFIYIIFRPSAYKDIFYYFKKKTKRLRNL